MNHKLIMECLENLPSCTLITTGRTGSDFLQSLLDSHPEVLLFNGSLFFYEFWNSSKCAQAQSFDLSDFFDEFIGRHIDKLKSIYDYRERKNQLGNQHDQHIDIDLKQFKTEAIALLNSAEPTSRNILLAIYGAYNLCLGHNLSDKKLFFHHLHNAERLEPYLNDFPDSKIIVMTRDPRANIVAGVLNWRRYDTRSDSGQHLFYYLKRIFRDIEVLDGIPNERIAIKLESLGDQSTLRNLCQWLNIEYHDTLEESTWGGLLWHGDAISVNQKDRKGFSPNLLDNKWETILNPAEQYIINFLLNSRLKHYGYKHHPIKLRDYFLVPFIIMLPLRFEMHFMSRNYLREIAKRRDHARFVANFYFFVRRLILFYRYYIRTCCGRTFLHKQCASRRARLV